MADHVSSSPPPAGDEMDHTPPSSDEELDMNDMSAIESDDGRSSQPSLTSLVHDQDSNDGHESDVSRGSSHNDQSVSESNGSATSKPSSTSRRPRVLKSMTQLKGTPLGETMYDGHKLWTVPLTERVSVVEKATGKERHGSWAPLGRNLPRWLYSNPTWSIGDPSTCRKRKQAKRRTSSTMNSSDAGKQCATPTKPSTKKAKVPSTNANNAASLADACKPSHILCAGLVQHQMLKGDVAIIDSMFQKAMKHSREGDFAAALDTFKTAKIIAASIKAKVSML
eukprot:m.39217 g.39217  ORF g.39217 m.39217 type:complete len:281 (-) comp10289_c0_seq1:1733-2575(-)